MRKYLFAVLFGLFITPLFATGIDANATSADCDNATLGQYNGTANLEMDWQPNTINVRWYSDDTQLSVPTNAQTCSYGGDLYLPTPPTKKGYTFEGWKVTVPTGYTELEYVTNAANTYLNTGIIQDIDDIELEIKVKPSLNSWYIFQNENSNRDIFGISGSYNGNTILWTTGIYHNHLQSSITRNSTHTYIIKGTSKYGNMTLYVKDLTANIEDTKAGTYTYLRPTIPFWLFGNQIDEHRAIEGNRVYYATMKIGGTLVMNYIPAKRNSDNAIGFYDTVSGTFKTADAGSLTAGPVVQ